MKAKKFLMAFAAIAAISTVSCTQEEELFIDSGANDQVPDGDVIAFGTYLAGAPESRAGIMNLDALKEKGFGVFGYYTGIDDYNIVNPDHQPNFMYNQEVTWKEGKKDEAGMWQYFPVKYWPSITTEKVSFFAYAPYTTTFGATGITALTSNSTAGDPKLSFKMDENVDNQIDLLYCNNAMDLTKQNIVEKVNLQFKHALSRIGFKRVAVIDENNTATGNYDKGTYDDNKHGKIKLTANSTVVINSVSISSEKFGESGDLNLRTGEWENYKAGSHTYTLTAENGDFINNTLTPANATTVMPLTKEEKYLTVMPNPVRDKYSNEEIPVRVTVNFDVITEDPNLAEGESRITSEITAPFNFEFGAGKSYNFVLHIGLTSVKLDASVEDWFDKDWFDKEDKNPDYDFVVNTPNNTAYTLVLDALEGRFRNGSEYYVISKFVDDLEIQDEEGVVFEIPYFYNNKLNHKWNDPANDIYYRYQIDNYGFVCWCDHIIDDLPAPMALHDKYDGASYKGYRFYSPEPLAFEDKWANEYDPNAPDLLIPSESTITIPKNDKTKFRTLYAVWPIGENHLD